MEKFKIIDSHAHCISKPELKADLFWFDQNYKNKIDNYLNTFKKNNLEKAIIYLLDEKALSIKCNNYTKLVFGLAINFRSPGFQSRVIKAKQNGFKSIKILTYEQKIVKKDYAAILSMAKVVEKQNMFLTICATFGGDDPYRHDALALARFLLKNGYRGSLILAHAGGSRIKEALLFAEAYPNVYFDTSFTTTFWRRSTVISDLSWGIKKYPNRFFFGSDSPYIGFLEAKKDAIEMLKPLSLNLRKKYFYTNIKDFLKQYE